VLSWLLGQRRRDAATNDPFESGIVSVGNSQVRISVEFYLVAIFFVIFDLETVFIFAWAIAFFELGWEGYMAMLVFIALLALVLIYEWRSGALDWGNKIRVGLSQAQAKEKARKTAEEKL
jgi:NADH-quinone oxidoreductase subunit A